MSARAEPPPSRARRRSVLVAVGLLLGALLGPFLITPVGLLLAFRYVSTLPPEIKVPRLVDLISLSMYAGVACPAVCTLALIGWGLTLAFRRAAP